jgi:hypothetical protein
MMSTANRSVAGTVERRQLTSHAAGVGVNTSGESAGAAAVTQIRATTAADGLLDDRRGGRISPIR